MLLSAFPVFSQNTQKQTVHVYDFINAGPGDTAHFSAILPDNIGIEIERTGYYNVRRAGNARLTEENVGSKEFLAESARSDDADYVVSGIYSVDDGGITITSYVYVTEAGELYRVVIPQQEVSVFINQLVDTLSVKISFELQKHLIRMSDPPVITPHHSGFKYYREITVKTDIPGAQLYYTTDGTTPSRKNGTRYTEPFNIYRTTSVNAIAVKEGWPASDLASREYEQWSRISMFELKALYGIMHFLESPDEMDSLGSAQVLSVVPVFYLGGIDSVKTVPFVRDLGIGGWFDLGNAPLATEFTYLMQGYGGGLFYKMRFHENFLVDLPVTYGIMNTAIGEKDGSNIFSEPVSGFEEQSDPYLSSGLLFNIRFGYVDLDFGPMFKYIQYEDADPAQLLTYYAGIGVNF